jgi:hypothetical protein
MDLLAGEVAGKETGAGTESEDEKSDDLQDHDAPADGTSHVNHLSFV